MAFELRVQFTGVCVHVCHRSRPEVAVLMPDARGRNHTDIHVDHRKGEHHVGYLRIDLASIPLAPDLPRIPTGTPAPGDGHVDPVYEVVYRIDRQTIDFGLPATSEPMIIENGLPDPEKFATALRLVDALFTNSPPTVLLSRTVLLGGEVTSTYEPENPDWTIAGTLNPPNYSSTVGKFPGSVMWKRKVDAEDLRLTIAAFDGSSALTLRLQPVEVASGQQVISLRLANLCARDPLEWPDFESPSVLKDDDFKWGYRLFEPLPGKTWDELLAGDKELPVPERQPFVHHGDCFGIKVYADFPSLNTV